MTKLMKCMPLGCCCWGNLAECLEGGCRRPVPSWTAASDFPLDLISYVLNDSPACDAIVKEAPVAICTTRRQNLGFNFYYLIIGIF
jgi:hypothetical protein